MIQVGEFQWVTKEEDGGVVTYQIPVTFFCIEFDGESANITFGICRSSFTGYGRETDKQFCFFSNL
jgi:hypothetical protein